MSLYQYAEILANLATIVGFPLALVTLIIGLWRYKRAQQFKKAEYFFELRKVFKGTEKYNRIRKIIDSNQDLNVIQTSDLWDYIGFFEELQIAINSNFVDSAMVYYFFGHYILTLNKSIKENNLTDLNTPLWAAFNNLVNTMETQAESFEYTNLKF